MRCFAILATLLFLTLESGAELSIPKSCEQAVCVTAAGWNSSTATLQRWERSGPAAHWSKVGEPVPVLVGEHGLGWGQGLHRTPNDGAPRKKEGDRRAPAGMFRLVSAFGQSTPPKCRLPWQPIVPTLEAVDDPASRFYNRIVDRQRIPSPDWKSSEQMATIPAYALGVVVAHNPQNIPGAGSCIFVHLWSANRTVGTAGCTVLKLSDLLTLVPWLDPAKEPVLIQLPKTVMDREWSAL